MTVSLIPGITCDGNFRVTNAGTFFVPANISGTWPVSSMVQRTLQEYPVALEEFVQKAAPETRLPGTATTTNLGILGTTAGTDSIHLSTPNINGVTAAPTARKTIWLPPNYDPGESFTIRVRAKMKTAVATSSCTIDVNCYDHDGDGAIGSDLCATAAQDMNSLTAGNYDFVITPSGLTAANAFDLVLTISYVDGGNSGTGLITKVSVLADTKGG